MLIIAMDANFRLKSHLWTTLNREPTLRLGLSYFVDNDRYTEFVKNYVDQEEVRECPLPLTQNLLTV